MTSKRMIGREEEKAIIVKSLAGVLESKGRTLLISGEAGIGKTMLVDFLVREAERLGMTVCTGDSTAQEASVPYSTIQKAMRQITDIQFFQAEEHVFFDEIFLISKIGLLISHVSRSEQTGLDEDILGSMLTAVQDFVKDSFGGGGSETQKGGLGKLEYMNTKIFIEHGDLVYLAVVTSGDEHPAMKQEIRRCLSEIESSYFDILSDWDGDIGSLEGTSEILRKTVQKQFSVKRSLENVNLETEKIKVQNRILDLLLASAQGKGLVLILEDVHWADSSTLLALPFLSRNISDSKILCCVTYRPGDAVKTGTSQDAVIKALAEQGTGTITIGLKPLGPESIRNVASHALGGHAPPEELMDLLNKSSDGNPLFISEAIMALISNRTLIKDKDMWIMKHGPNAVLPHSIAELVAERLESLDLDSLRILEYGAVLGRRFPRKMLGSAFGIEPGKLERTIDDLLHMNLLVQASEDELMFQHSKTQEVAYSGLSDRWRKTMHRNAGMLIESMNHDDLESVIYSLAYHFSNANDFDRGIEYSLSAGTKARNNLAPRESIQFFEKAAELIELSGREDERRLDIYESLGELHELDGNYNSAMQNYNRVSQISDEVAIQIRIFMKKGRVLQSESKYDDAISEYEKGVALAEKSEQPFWKAKIQGYMGKIYLRKGMYDRALDYQVNYLKESQNLNDAKELGQAYMNVGGVYYFLKDYSQAILNWKKASELFEKVEYKQGIAFVNDNLGGAHLMLGKLEEALDYYKKSQGIMTRIGDAKGLSMVLNNMGALYDDMGEYQTSLDLYQKSLQIKKRIGDLVGVANIFNNIGSSYFNMGNSEMALRNYQENLALMQSIGDTWGISQALNNITEAEIELGRTDDASGHCRESLELAERHSFKEIKATIFRLQGSLAALDGDMERSEALFNKSLALAEEIKEPQKVGLAHLSKARALKAQGLSESAVDSYARALSIFEGTDMKGMKLKIRREMQELVDTLKD